MDLEKLMEMWEMHTAILVNAKKQLNAIVNLWRLQKNWETDVKLEEFSEIW